jgi:hypothetical protein
MKIFSLKNLVKKSCHITKSSSRKNGSKHWLSRKVSLQYVL